MVFIAIIAYALIVGIGGTIIWNFAFRDNEIVSEFKGLDKQRSMIAYEMNYRYQKANVFDRWQMRRYLKKGEGLL
jgi:hypothetical protein